MSSVASAVHHCSSLLQHHFCKRCFWTVLLMTFPFYGFFIHPSLLWGMWGLSWAEGFLPIRALLSSLPPASPLCPGSPKAGSLQVFQPKLAGNHHPHTTFCSGGYIFYCLLFVSLMLLFYLSTLDLVWAYSTRICTLYAPVAHSEQHHQV